MGREASAAFLAATSCSRAGGGLLFAGSGMLIKLLCGYQKKRLF